MLKRLDYLFVGRTRGSGRVLCAAAVLLVTSGLAAAQSLSVTQHLPRPCVASAGRAAHVILGEMKAGERFERRAGRFTLRLTPVRYDDVKIPVGWEIGVFEPGREEDLSQLTLPLRGPNGRDLVAWHFRNKDNTGPNEGKVDAPGSHREFIFSPQVGRTIRYEEDVEKMLANVSRIEAFGRGTLDLLDFRMTRPARGKTPAFIWVEFAACLTWPR